MHFWRLVAVWLRTYVSCWDHDSGISCRSLTGWLICITACCDCSGAYGAVSPLERDLRKRAVCYPVWTTFFFFFPLVIYFASLVIVRVACLFVVLLLLFGWSSKKKNTAWKHVGVVIYVAFTYSDSGLLCVWHLLLLFQFLSRRKGDTHMVHPISLAPRSTAIFRRERARSTVRHCISLCDIWALAERASTGGQWDFSFSTNYFYRLCRLHSFSDSARS